MQSICDYKWNEDYSNAKGWKNLHGVSTDINNMIHLWSTVYNYQNISVAFAELNKEKANNKQKNTKNNTNQSVNKTDNNPSAMDNTENFHDFLTSIRAKIVVQSCNDGLIFYYSGDGVKNAIILKNGKKFMIKEIYEIFDGKQCKTLRNKPKIMIFDSCRGNEIGLTDEIPTNMTSKGKEWAIKKSHKKSGYATIFSTVEDEGVNDSKYGGCLTRAIKEVFKNPQKISTYSLRRLILPIRRKTKINSGPGYKEVADNKVYGSSSQLVDFHETLEYEVYFVRNGNCYTNTNSNTNVDKNSSFNSDNNQDQKMDDGIADDEWDDGGEWDDGDGDWGDTENLDLFDKNRTKTCLTVGVTDATQYRVQLQLQIKWKNVDVDGYNEEKDDQKNGDEYTLAASLNTEMSNVDGHLDKHQFFYASIARHPERNPTKSSNGMKFVQCFNLVQEIKDKHKILTQIENHLNKNKILRGSKIAPPSKVLLMIGESGAGKSVVGNRLTGKTDDIDTWMDHNIKHGDVSGIAEFVSVESSTQHITQISKVVTMRKINAYANNGGKGDPAVEAKFNLTVLDTPSNVSDTVHEYEIIECVNYVGGVNVFLLFFRTGNKLSKSYQKLIKKHETFWGKDKFWKHCMVIVTHTDHFRPIDAERYITTIRGEFEDLYYEFKKNQVPIFKFGDNDFKSSVEAILWNTQKDHRYTEKCLFEGVSPFETKFAELLKLFEKYQPLASKLDAL